jgi:replication factor A1
LTKIKDKVRMASGLVSEEGAAYLLASEYGINLCSSPIEEFIKIKNITEEVLGINVIGRILRIFPVRTFQRQDGRQGKVVNVILQDDTGIIRTSFWDKDANLITSGKFNVGDVIKIIDCYAKKNNLGQIELRVSRRSRIMACKDTNLEIPSKTTRYTKGTIISLDENSLGKFKEIKASLVQIFPRITFFYLCTECRTSVAEGECCRIHNTQYLKPSVAISGFIDDETGVMKVVFFGQCAETLMGLSAEDARKIDKDLLIERINENLGKEFIIRGKIAKDEYFNSLEIHAIYVDRNINYAKEAEKLFMALKNQESAY